MLLACQLACQLNMTAQMGNRPRAASIHILDDDSLLHVFYLYRPFLLGEEDDYYARFEGGRAQWVRGRWWYRLAHVCQRWRYIILGSASYLGISLICTRGTPVADMVTHSPPLPLVIDYFLQYHDISAEDGEQIIHALRHRGRVSRIRLNARQQRLIMAMDDEYSNLKYLIVVPPKDESGILIFPETLQAPQLCHLTLAGFSLPIKSRLLTSAVGLVTLCLFMRHSSTYFHPNTLFQWISIMPQLETLVIRFSHPDDQHDVERLLMLTPITTPVTLPNLQYFKFDGDSTYSEALVRRIAAPRLEKLSIFFKQLIFLVPHLQQLMNTTYTTENLRFDSARFVFMNERVCVVLYLREVQMVTIGVECWHLDWQVSSMTHISNSLSQVFSAVEHLAFEHVTHHQSSEEHNEVDRTKWRELLRPFNGVKTLRIAGGLVGELSRSLQSEDGEFPLELLSELQELTFPREDNNDDAFTSFINSHEDAGRTVTLVRS